jgi:Leucine rich repeat
MFDAKTTMGRPCPIQSESECPSADSAAASNRNVVTSDDSPDARNSCSRFRLDAKTSMGGPTMTTNEGANSDSAAVPLAPNAECKQPVAVAPSAMAWASPVNPALLSVTTEASRTARDCSGLSDIPLSASSNGHYHSTTVAMSEQPGAFRVQPGGTRVAVAQKPDTFRELPCLEAPLSVDEATHARANGAVDDQVVLPGTLAEAVDHGSRPPSPAIDSSIPKACEISPSEISPCWIRCQTILLLTIVMVTVATAIVTGVLVKDSNRSSSFERFMASSSWSIDTRPIAANDTASPQAQALRWLARDLQYNSSRESWQIRQRYALAVFYFSLGGQWWFNTTGWLSVNDECSWYSMDVSCDDRGRYVSLALGTNSLSGTLPLDLGYLTDLRRLYLYHNYLSGAVPTTIVSLRQLKDLELNENALSGPIPTEIWLLTLLESLLLASNQFTGQISSQLGKLTDLTDLYFNENSLTGTIPAQIGLLHLVNYLTLDGNLLSGAVPTLIGLSHKIIEGSVRDNLLEGTIPTEIGFMTSLRAFDLSSNLFSGTIPSEL